MTTGALLLPQRGSTYWDRVATDGWYRYPLTSEELLHFEQHFPDHRGQTVIDAGCGTGEFTRHLYAQGFDVTCIDWSPASITQARRSVRCPLPYLVHDLGAGDPPGLVPRSVDLVVCRQTVSLLDDPAELLYRIRTSWLKPGGHLYLSEIRLPNQKRTVRGGITDQQLAQLGNRWARAVRYDLDEQPTTCVILRSPAA